MFLLAHVFRESSVSKVMSDQNLVLSNQDGVVSWQDIMAFQERKIMCSPVFASAYSTKG